MKTRIHLKESVWIRQPAYHIDVRDSLFVNRTNLRFTIHDPRFSSN